MICKNTCIKKEDVYYRVICLQSNPLLLDSELVFQVWSGLKCTLSSIPPFHPVLPSSIFPLSDHISVSTYVQKCMQLVMKMADLTKFLQTEWILIWILWFWQTSVKFLKAKSDWWNWQFWKIFVKFVIAKSAWQIWRFWCIFVTACTSGHKMINVTKMADLMKFLRTKWILMDFMILTNISQIPQSEIRVVELTILTKFCWIFHSKISLADLKILMHFCYCMHFWT